MSLCERIERIPAEILADQWYSFMHKLIGGMQSAYQRAREKRDLSQIDIACRLGKDPATISKCLSGQRNMTVRTIHDLARAMDCRLEVQFVPLESLQPANRPPSAVGTLSAIELSNRASAKTPAASGTVQLSLQN